MKFKFARRLSVVFCLLIAQFSFAQTSKTSVQGLVRLNGQDVNFVYENGKGSLNGMNCQFLGGIMNIALGACGATAPEYGLTILFLDEVSMDSVADPATAAANKGKTLHQFLTEQFAQGDAAKISNLVIKKENCPADATALVGIIATAKSNPGTSPEDMIAATQVSCAKLEVK